ncbi:hypothetical protein BJF79_09625 [Actinomadura sp. CNU-125]|uniref:sugar phosphate isomerase/epimerase family protein n=1 Tax=Actinomadura sp. CNU-125 TaxID=1904961 RepID=UPI000968AE30|nr:sugar phosphate isomerase/epimerase family protein [Actinomadura sp. CNU-125]OLT30495.1 hypothetical protein BJF79_09625 [Actinomadura sp. CNU-125]
MKLCLNRVTLSRDTSAGEVVRASHAAGFPFVELSARRLLEAVSGDPQAAELVSSGAITPVHGGWSIRLHWERDRFEQALPEAIAEMEAVARLGSRSGALVLPRQRPDTGFLVPGREETLDRIGRVAAWAASFDLSLMLEFNGLHTFDRSDRGCRTLKETVELIRCLGSPNVGVLLDSYHWHASGGTAHEVAEIPADMPIFVHLNDAPDIRRHLLDDSLRQLPGDGCIDLPALLAALQWRGYEGPLSVELKNRELHSRSPYEAARLAHRAAARVLEQPRPHVGTATEAGNS